MAREDKFVWKAGDVIITDRDGNVIDLDKLDEEPDDGEEEKPEK